MIDSQFIELESFFYSLDYMRETFISQINFMQLPLTMYHLVACFLLFAVFSLAPEAIFELFEPRNIVPAV
jgi:hypothetical protein